MLPIFAFVSVCLSPLHSPSLSFPCYALPPSLPPLSLSLSLSFSFSLSHFRSPIPRPPHLFSLFSFYCSCLFAFLCVRESLAETDTKIQRELDIERVRERYAVSMSTYGWNLVCLLKAAVPVD